MNVFRLGLLLLLALALPVRATLGAAPPVLGAPVETAASTSVEAGEAACEHDGADDTFAHAHDAGRTACHACAACCAASAPPAALPAIIAPNTVVAAAFPAPPSRPASFLGDTPRRPPRRC